VHKLILQKSNGTWYVVLWNDKDTLNENNNYAYIGNPSVNVTVNFGQNCPSVKTYLPIYHTGVVNSYANISSGTFSVPDHPLVIEIAPLVSNPGFESNLTGWTKWNDTNWGGDNISAAYADGTGPQSGNFCLTHYNGQGGTWDVYTSQKITGLANGLYDVSFYARYNGSGFTEKTAYIKAPSGWSIVNIDSTSYKQYIIKGVSVTNGQIDEIGFYSKVQNGSGYPFLQADSIVVTPNKSSLNNGDFEYGDVNWTTWNDTNWGGNNDTAGFLDNISPLTGQLSLAHYKGQTSGTFDVYTSQNLTNLMNGLYTLTFKARYGGNGFTEKRAYAKAASGWKVIDITSTATQTYQVRDINVTDGNCEIGFYTKVQNGTNWPLVLVDDVKLIKQ
jgi:uncharacterized protein YcnI